MRTRGEIKGHLKNGKTIKTTEHEYLQSVRHDLDVLTEDKNSKVAVGARDEIARLDKEFNYTKPTNKRGGKNVKKSA